MTTTPFFSIILATRDRPKMFLTALHSIADQTFDNKEVIVVVDGSSDANMAQYRRIEQQRPDITFHYLTHRENGHGQSYSVNYGASKSSGQYLCCLDDDDEWTDLTYLETLHASITACPDTVDVHYSHQKAMFADGRPQTELVWLEDLIPQASKHPEVAPGAHRVDRDFLLRSQGFGHLNCSVIRREFFNAIKGMDESIRYENDREFYLRSIDQSQVILFSTRYISLHHIPDTSRKDNMSTMASNIEKKLYQLRVYDKGIALGKSRAIVDFCRQAKTYELKHLTGILAGNGNLVSAAQYAREALGCGFNLRWLAYTLQLSVRAWFSPGTGQQES